MPGTSRYRLLSLLVAVVFCGCHGTVTPPPPPVTHEDVLTITPADDATPATTYNLYRSTAGTATWTLIASGIPESAPSYDDTAIVAGVMYEYRATAVDQGVESPPSNTVVIIAQ